MNRAEVFRLKEEAFKAKRIAAEIAQKRIDCKNHARLSKVIGRVALAYAAKHPPFDELLRKAVGAGSLTDSERRFLAGSGWIEL